MKKIILIILIIAQANNLKGCTLFWSAQDDKILCAKNMDWPNKDTRMLFIPASEGKYGRMYFGIESGYGFTNTSGMNEMGLWYAGASLPERTDIYNTYNKPRWDYELVEKIMEECSTVDEAIEVFSVYWEPHWSGHTLIADKYGDCVAIEYGENDVVFIRNDQNFQVMTNFYLSDTINERWYNCYRYNIAYDLLSNNPELSFGLFRDIAKETHAEGDFQTTLTTIHDLNNGLIQVYNMHNYHEFVCINLAEELEKGKHYIKCSDYFNQVQLIEPAINSVLSNGEVTFSWYSDSYNYDLYYSKNKDFLDSEKIEINNMHLSNSRINPLMFIGLLILLIFYKRNRKSVIFSFVFVLILAGISCEENDLEPQFSKTKHSVTIKGLESETTYYWRIICNNGVEYKSESVSWKFKTM
jgi:Acyl-coenzyme A:6-aminopenicillanic acid acyl-transferase